MSLMKSPPALWATLRSRILLGIASAALIGLAALICYDVAARYLLSAPTRWGFEISTYLMAIAVTFGAAHTLNVGGHIRVDVVYDRLTGRRRVIADLMAWAAGVIFCAVLTWRMAELALRSFRAGARSMDLNLPLAVPQALIALGTAAITVEAIVLFVAALRRLRGEAG